MIEDDSSPIEGRLLELSYRISCDDPFIRHYLRTVLRDSAERVGADAVHFEFRLGADLGDRLDGEAAALFVDGDEQAAGSTAWVFSNLLYRLNRSTVAASPDAVVLHAAAVELGGVALVVAGRSGSGKTVTSLGLAARGFSLLSDDIVRLRADGLIDGSRKPVGIRAQGRSLLGLDAASEAHLPDSLVSLETVPVAATSLGVAYGAPGVPRTVVFPDADQPVGSLHELTRGQGLARLCDQTFSLSSAPTDGFEALGAAFADARFVVWGRGSLDALYDELDPGRSSI